MTSRQKSCKIFISFCRLSGCLKPNNHNSAFQTTLCICLRGQLFYKDNWCKYCRSKTNNINLCSILSTLNYQNTGVTSWDIILTSLTLTCANPVEHLTYYSANFIDNFKHGTVCWEIDEIIMIEEAAWRCSIKKIFFKSSPNLQRNTCARDCTFIKREPLTQVFSCEFCEILNTFLKENIWDTSSYLVWFGVGGPPLGGQKVNLSVSLSNKSNSPK